MLATVIFLVITILHLYFRKYTQYSVLVLFVMASLALNQVQQKPLSRNLTEKPATYEAIVQEDSVMQEGLSKTVLRLQNRLEPLPAIASGQVQFTGLGACDWSAGSKVVFQGAVKGLEGYHNPGGFQYDDYLRRKNIWGTVFVEDCQSVQVTFAKPRWGLAKWRYALLQKIYAPHIEHPDILSALLLGTNTIDQVKNQKIRTAGLSHLFVISGLQFALMSAMVFFLCQKVFNFFPKLFLKIPRQKLCSIVTLMFVIFYMGLINHQPSVLRAGLTIGFYLLATIFEKQKNLLHVVLMSMAVALFLYPMDLFHLGFQMSYLCVLTLILVAPKQWVWISERPLFKNLSPRTLVVIKMVWVTWLLNLMLLPIVLYDFGEISLNGLLQNLWAIPYFEFLVTPIGFVYLFTALLSLKMAPYILIFWDGTIKLFWLLFGYFEVIALPTLRAVSPHEWHLWIFYVGIFLFFYVGRRWILRSTLALLVVGLSFTLYQTHFGFDFRITQIDVGQGDAVLVQTPDKTYLIDAGGHAFRDVGKLVLLPALNYMWVRHIDTVIITHGDADHYKGLTNILDSLSIGEVWVNDLTASDPQYAALLQTMADLKIPVIAKNEHEAFVQKDGTQVEVFSPSPLVANLPDKNDHSIVVKMQKNHFSALFTGDISGDAEKILVENYGDKLKADFLKVAHHGSNTSTSQLFLGFVQPKYASIGVKSNSPFGHPTPEVLAKLKEYNSEILRTDANGQIQISVKRDQVKVTKFLE